MNQDSPRPQLRLIKSPAPEPALPAFPEIYEQYRRYVGAIAVRLLGREDEVRDVVQDVFVSALEKLHEIERAESIKGWLSSITVNKVISRLRWRKVRQSLRLEAAAASSPAVQGNPERAALLARVYRELDRLPVKQRVAWTLRHVQEQSLEEVAAACRCSLATVKRWIASAQRLLERLDATDLPAAKDGESSARGEA